jgi:protein required for attachment to host cells
MPIHVKLLFVVADGEHARFVRPADEDNTLKSASRADLDEAHASASAPSHSEAGEKFAAWVADQLNRAVNSYDELVLVAPAHTLNTIRKELNTVAAKKLIDTLGKDLTKIPSGELWPHLRQWVRPVHRAKIMP